MSRGNITRRGKSSWRIKIERRGETPGKPESTRRPSEVAPGRREAADRAARADRRGHAGRPEQGHGGRARACLDRGGRDSAEDARAIPAAVRAADRAAPRQHRAAEAQAGDDRRMARHPAGEGRQGRSAAIGPHRRPCAPGATRRHQEGRQERAAGAQRRRYSAPPKVEDEEVEILDDTDVPVVLAKLATHALGPIAATALAIRLPARRAAGAGLGLHRPRQGDGAHRALPGADQEARREGCVLRFKRPKTKAGVRTLSLPASAVAVLRKHRSASLSCGCSSASGSSPTTPWSSAGRTGSPIPPNDLSRDWARACKSRACRACQFHALRHTHASALIASGMDVVAISKRLGHKSPTTTLRIYAHVFAKLSKDAAAADAIEAVMRGGASEM